jgi:hypothetical protein
MTFPHTNAQGQENGSDMLMYKHNTTAHTPLWTYQVSQTETMTVLNTTDTT